MGCVIMSDAEKKLDLLPIMSPLFNLREVCKQSSLLEDHLNNPRKRCHDCIRKHFLTIEALFEEAISLDKDFKYGEHLDGKAHEIRELQALWLDSKEKKNHNAEYLEIAQKLRGMRKGFAPLCFDVRKMASLDRVEATCNHKRYAAMNKEAFLEKFFRDLPVVGGIIRLLSDGRPINKVVGDKMLAKKKELFQKLYSNPNLNLDEHDLDKYGETAKKEIIQDLKGYALDIDVKQVPVFKSYMKTFIRKNLTRDLTDNPVHDKMVDSNWDSFRQMISLKVKVGDEVRFPFYPRKGYVLVAHDPRNLIFSVVKEGYIFEADPDMGNYMTIEKKRVGSVNAIVFSTGFETELTVFNPAILKQISISSSNNTAKTASFTPMRRTAAMRRDAGILKSILRNFGWGKFILGFLAEHRPAYQVIKEAESRIIGDFFKFYYKSNTTNIADIKGFLAKQLKALSVLFMEWSVDTNENAAIKAEYKRASTDVLAIDLIPKLDQPSHERRMGATFNTLKSVVSKVRDGEEMVFDFFPLKRTESLILISSADMKFGVVSKDYMLEDKLSIRYVVEVVLVPYAGGVPAHIAVKSGNKVLAVVTDPEKVGRPTLLGAIDFDLESKARLASLRRRATLSQTEREDNKISELVRPHPKNKPPRNDLRNRNIASKEDSDFQGMGGGHKGDRDLSMQSDKAASVRRVMMRAASKKK